MTQVYSELPVTKKTGAETLTFLGKSTGISVMEFWKWSVSDLLNNSTRGVLAEYIVASALKITDGVRVEWDSFDLITNNNLKIEIKSSAYLQTWSQKQLSKISFGIQPTSAWNPKTGKFSKEVKRQSDVYVFCVLASKDPKTVDPLCLDQWGFYILPTKVLNEKIPNQKTITLGSLEKLGPKKSNYQNLETIINDIGNGVGPR